MKPLKIGIAGVRGIVGETDLGSLTRYRPHQVSSPPCTHLANVVLRPNIEAVCRAAGYDPPLNCTPEALSAGGSSNG
jgi:hypothetical protein